MYESKDERVWVVGLANIPCFLEREHRDIIQVVISADRGLSVVVDPP